MEQNSIRGRIRSFARQENRIGALCSILLQLCQGDFEAAKETYQLHFIQDRARITISGRERKRQEETVFSQPVTFSILVPLYNTPVDFLKEMIDSVRKQTYPKWELCLADGSDENHKDVLKYCTGLAAEDERIRYRKLEENRGISENTNACFEMATGDYIALFDHDDLLHPSALYECMKVICEQGADYVYTDEVVFASPKVKNIISTHYKPDWSPENLLTNNYICHLFVFRRELTEKAGVFRKEYDGSQDYDLILRVTDCAEKVVHIPKVLYFWRSHPQSVASSIESKGYAIEAGRKAVQDFLKERKGIEAEVESVPECPTMYRVHYPIGGEPLVSVIAICEGDPEEGRKWAEKLRGRTEYGNVEFAVVAPEGAGRAERLNRAAERAQGEYLLFLEEGLMPESESWIEEMLMLCRQKEIGAVGSVIATSEGRVLQAGLILGFGRHGCTGRNYFNIKEESKRYQGQLFVVEDVTAVGAECLMTSRELFFASKGFDTAYGDALFDADLCMRYREMGLRNVYTPFAKMRSGQPIRSRNIEPGASRESYGEDAERFRRRWQREIEAGDPYYNPHFSLKQMDYIPRKTG